MRVEELMSTATCCREGDSVRDCARKMKEESIGFVPICSDDGKPIGAVTDRDLAIRVLAEGRSGDDKVGAFMTRDVVGCRIGDDVKEAERLMREQRRSRVMVCDAQGKVKGVISLADIVDVERDEEAGETLQQVKSDQPPAH
jgi:signal-transduction protein with cAMP-binding, CBS, and nucleotidyltransferase domain